MLDDVRQRLLDKAVDGRLDLGREAVLARFRIGEQELADDRQRAVVAAAFEQRLERRAQPEFVERRRAQIADDGVQVLDLLLDLIDRLIDRGVGLRGVGAPPGGGEQQAHSAEALQRLVVKLARPAAPLGVRGGHRAAQPIGLHAACQGERVGGARRECGEHQFVVVGERLGAGGAVERRQHTHRHPARDHRNEERRLRVADAELARRDPQPGADIGDALRSALLEHLTGGRVGDWYPAPVQVDRVSRGGGHDKVGALAEQDHDSARVDQGPATLDDQFEHTPEARVAADRDRDVSGRLERANGSLLLDPTMLADLIQAGVLDRGRRPVGQNHGRLLVGLGEVAVLFLGEIQVAPDRAANHDRHTEEAAHRRVTIGEAVAARVLAHIGQAERLRLRDQHSEHAPPARQVANRRARLVVDAERYELAERGPLVIEDPERRIAGSGDLPRGRQNPVENSQRIELRYECAPGVEQAGQAG